MANKENIKRVGSFKWIASAEISTWTDAEEEQPTNSAECFTCGQPIGNAASWYCAENGEEVHSNCRIPNFDNE